MGWCFDYIRAIISSQNQILRTVSFGLLSILNVKWFCRLRLCSKYCKFHFKISIYFYWFRILSTNLILLILAHVVHPHTSIINVPPCLTVGLKFCFWNSPERYWICFHQQIYHCFNFNCKETQFIGVINQEISFWLVSIVYNPMTFVRGWDEADKVNGSWWIVNKRLLPNPWKQTNKKRHGLKEE